MEEKVEYHSLFLSLSHSLIFCHFLCVSNCLSAFWSPLNSLYLLHYLFFSLFVSLTLSVCILRPAGLHCLSNKEGRIFSFHRSLSFFLCISLCLSKCILKFLSGLTLVAEKVGYPSTFLSLSLGLIFCLSIGVSNFVSLHFEVPSKLYYLTDREGRLLFSSLSVSIFFFPLYPSLSFFWAVEKVGLFFYVSLFLAPSLPLSLYFFLYFPLSLSLPISLNRLQDSFRASLSCKITSPSPSLSLSVSLCVCLHSHVPVFVCLSL